jgi:hypothetical protein
MTRVVWVVMILLILGLGIPAVLVKSGEEKVKTFPEQEAARLVLVPTDKTRRVIVPPCGTGVPVGIEAPEKLAQTPGTIAFLLQKGVAVRDRLVLVPRCQASQGTQPSEGAQLPAAAFVLPTEAQVTAGRGGSAQAGTELVQAQLQITNGSPIETVIVPRCIESREQAKKSATGRVLVLKSQRSRRDAALAPPC